MNTRSRKWIVLTLLALAAGAGGFAWWKLRPAPLPPGFAMSNGRIEATQIDIATKLPGRIRTCWSTRAISWKSGQIVARMDTQTLDAELRQAQAQVSAGAQRHRRRRRRWSHQRESELTYAQNTLKRSEELVEQRLRQPAEAGRGPHRDAHGQSRAGRRAVSSRPGAVRHRSGTGKRRAHQGRHSRTAC